MNLTIETHEVRWIFSGQIPPEVADWFTVICDPDHQPTRTDLYLTGLDECLGIKLREGRIEIKRRQGVGEVAQFGPGCLGRVQAWTKYGLDLIDPAEISLAGGWLPVTKQRRARYFQASGNKILVPIPPGSYPERGGGLELTAVTLPDGEPWWTVGAEVFGPEDCRPTDLLAMVAWLLAVPGCPVLSLDASLSYPAWLTGL